MSNDELKPEQQEILDDPFNTFQTAKPMSLVAKLAEACDAVGGVEKLGKNEQQNYKYVKAADVAKAIRHELFKRGIVIIPNEISAEYSEFPTKSGGTMRECRLIVDYNVTDGAETLHFMAFGTAFDSGDKAIWKAKTGVLKYFLRGLGLIPDEKDDPEFDEHGETIIKRTPAEQKEFAKQKASKLKEQLEESLKVTPADEGGTNRITQKQQARLFAISKTKGWPDAAVRDLLGSYGFEHSNEITVDKYDEIVGVIEKGQ